jgi:hypothetical protein
VTKTRTKPASREEGRVPAVTRYGRPGAGAPIIGVSGPLGSIEFTLGGSGTIRYHGNAPRYAGHEITPCPGLLRGCYHSDGPDASSLTTLTRSSITSDPDVVLYPALEILYRDWADTAQPSQPGRATATSPGTSARPAPAARNRIRTRSSLPELRQA